MAQEKKCPPEGLPGWMGTYGDLVTLLLCFFVLLYAFSTTDSQKFKNLIMSFRGTFGVMKGGKTISPDALLSSARVEYKGSEYRYQYIAKKVEAELKKYSGDKTIRKEDVSDEQQAQQQEKQQKELEDKITQEDTDVKITERGIEISLGDKVLFDLAKANLKPGASDVLDIVLNNIKDIENNIVVEGHTDNWSINTKEFPSNWELSAARATTVLKYFVGKEGRIKDRLSLAGFSDTRPISDNNTKNGRQKK
jgi:chemotaxis protein MotB